MHDSHVHSIFSDDGMEAVEDVVATALSRGCDYVAITDHVAIIRSSDMTTRK